MSSADKQPASPTAAAVEPKGRFELGSQRESAAYAAFDAVFESSREALLTIDATGIIQRANPRARKLLRLDDSNLREKGIGDFFSSSFELWKTRSLGQAFAAFPRGLDASLANGFPVRVTLRSILPVSQYLLLSLEEDAAAQDFQPLARQLEAELRTALDSLQEGVLILDASGRVRFSNRRLSQLLGVGEPGEIKTFDELVHLLGASFRSPEIFPARFRAFLGGAALASHDDLEILGPTPRMLERFSRPVCDSAGRNVGWMETYSDVTERRQIQSKMLQTEKMVALGQVVSGIAHELNNPLTAIMGYVQLLLGQGLQPGSLAHARMVYQEAARARRIVKNLLYFARENKPERSAVDLNEIVERTLALRSYELKVENISVATDLFPNLPRTMADPYQLQQVILNLLMNAEQAIVEAKGRGHIRIRTRRLAQKPAYRIALELADDGPGIPPQVAPRIFDPFFTTKAPGFGTGLGLSIVYGIVRQHDGEVAFASEPGAGTKFTIELPVVPPPEGYRLERKIHLTGRPAVKPARILVVEDEPTVAQLVADVLQEEGHRVDGVLDGREGLDLLSRRSYDLVICDLRMPGLDGRAFFRSLVRTRNPVRHRLLIITGDTLAPATLEFLEVNRLPYLAKPFLVEELKLAVRRQFDVWGGASKTRSRERNGGGHGKRTKSRKE